MTAKNTVVIRARVPAETKKWLEEQPGGISKAIRRLVKEQQWEESGQTPVNPYDRVTVDGRKRWKRPDIKPKPAAEPEPDPFDFD